MTEPIISTNIRPTMRLKKRQGTFLTGSSEYNANGSFRLTMDENRSSVVEAFIDNIPHINETRILDSLAISDRLLLVMEGTDRLDHAIFNGVITQILFDRANTLLRITAQDSSFVGASTILNDILHQKFVDVFETTLDDDGTEFTVTLPADTDLAAPITVLNRVGYGNPLRTAHNSPDSLDFDVVYSSPIINKTLRGTLDATLESIDGAKKYAAQTFIVNRDTQITNIFFPIAQYIRLYPGEAPPDGTWNQFGIGELQNIVNIPEAQSVDSSTFSMPHTRMGPNNSLRVSLVKCVRTTSAVSPDDRKTLTKSGRDVANAVFVPTNGAPGDEHLNYEEGSFFDVAEYNGAALYYEKTEVLATIDISPTEPIPAPHYPTGETIKMTHKWSQLHDDSSVRQEAYTLFGWNLEESPINAENGDTLALVFEQLGNPNHPDLTDGVEPTDKSNPNSYLTPHAMWALGISRLIDKTVPTNTYEKGDYLVSAHTSRIGNTRTLIGTHGMAAFRPLQDSDNLLPNYNGAADIGVWEYNDKLNDLSDIANWNTALNGMATAIEDTVNFLSDPTGLFNQGTLDRPGDLPTSLETGGLYAGLNTLSSMYFAVITGNWIRLGRGLYWDIDDSGKVNFGKGSVSWTPFSTNRFGLNMAKVAMYTNPSTGGLLDANNKSSVYDVANAIVGKIPNWHSTIVDGLLDGIDDVEGQGYNNPDVYPLSYWEMKEETAWASVQRLAVEFEASVRIHTDITGLSTLMFEKRKELVDFQFDSPGLREYTISSRKDDPTWMKYLVDSRIESDIDTMYSRFRIIGNQNVEVGDTHMQLGLPVGQPSPIVFELDIPENEAKLGFIRQKEFKSETNITTHAQALLAAQAMKTLYANDTYSGTIELAGLWPLYEHPALGLMLDSNCILRLIDDKSVSGDSETGTENIFRITGIHYSSQEHKTDLTLSTSVINREVNAAKTLLDNLKKKTEASTATHISRLGEPIFGNRLLIPSTIIDGTIEVYLNYAQSSGNPTSTPISGTLLLEVNETQIAGANAHVVAVFEPGVNTIESDILPWVAGEIRYQDSSGTHIVDFNIDATYKYSADTLTVIIPVELT